jgi:hypothetical protein
MEPGNKVDAHEVLTYMVCDVVAGMVHSGVDMGFTLEEIQDAIGRGIGHARTERKITLSGKCSHCERPY